MWKLNGEEFTSEMISDYIGFVYVVTNSISGLKYIGKKKFWATRTLKPLKDQKRKRIQKLESDWKDYFGSSEEVKKLVLEHGRDVFERKIIRLCKYPAEMSYYEIKEQIENDVLLKPKEYYNAFVGGKINRNHLKRIDEYDN